MSEKTLSEELKERLFACTFADLTRAAEAFSLPSRLNATCARAAEAFDTLPKSVRKRVAKLKVFDSAELIIGLVERSDRTTLSMNRRAAPEEPSLRND
jgi:hypothetical protein